MNTIENTVGGTFREGRIVLDRPMNWAEGTRVVVQLLEEDAGLIEGVWPADGSPEGEAEILRRMAEVDAEEITPEEVEAFEAALQQVEQFNKECLSKQMEQQP
jgi:hypothetical protein